MDGKWRKLGQNGAEWRIWRFGLFDSSIQAQAAINGGNHGNQRW
jgi:hypothetical protein